MFINEFEGYYVPKLCGNHRSLLDCSLFFPRQYITSTQLINHFIKNSIKTSLISRKVIGFSLPFLLFPPVPPYSFISQNRNCSTFQLAYQQKIEILVAQYVNKGNNN
jgi:hypothetical protein